MNKTLELILRKFWAQHKGFQAKTIQEKLYTISLDYVICVDKCLAFQNSKLQESEEDNELFKIRLALDIIMLKSLKSALDPLVIV